MIKLLFTILLYTSCSVEKPIQVKELEVVCKEVTIVLRNDGLHYWTTWESKDGKIKYDSYGKRLYRVGEVRILLVKS